MQLWHEHALPHPAVEQRFVTATRVWQCPWPAGSTLRTGASGALSAPCRGEGSYFLGSMLALATRAWENQTLCLSAYDCVMTCECVEAQESWKLAFNDYRLILALVAIFQPDRDGYLLASL